MRVIVAKLSRMSAVKYRNKV